MKCTQHTERNRMAKGGRSGRVLAPAATGQPAIQPASSSKCASHTIVYNKVRPTLRCIVFSTSMDGVHSHHIYIISRPTAYTPFRNQLLLKKLMLGQASPRRMYFILAGPVILMNIWHSTRHPPLIRKFLEHPRWRQDEDGCTREEWDDGAMQLDGGRSGETKWLDE